LRAWTPLVVALAFADIALAGTLHLSADLDGDGTTEYLSITHKSIVNGHPMGGEIIASHKVHGRLITVWRQPNLNPWKLQIGDVDGDRHKEIVVGVWKKSRYDPVMAKRAFVYSWDGTRLLPKWLGSRLSRRFTDFVLCPMDKDGKTELIALEEAPGGANYITAYRWRAFGFDWIGRVGPVRGVTGISVKNGFVIVSTKRDTQAFVLVNGKPTLTVLREAQVEKRIRS
jgi:hypothetical protein